MQKRNLIWTLVFLLIFLLTQSHHLFNYSSNPGLFGLPSWLWWFMSFHVLLVVALLIYAKEIGKLEGIDNATTQPAAPFNIPKI